MTSQNLTLRPSTSDRFDIDLNTSSRRSSPSRRGTCSLGTMASQRERQTCWGGRRHLALTRMTRSKWPHRFRGSTAVAWPFRRNRDLACVRPMRMTCRKILVVLLWTRETRVWQHHLRRSSLLRLRPDVIRNNYWFSHSLIIIAIKSLKNDWFLAVGTSRSIHFVYWYNWNQVKDKIITFLLLN